MQTVCTLEAVVTAISELQVQGFLLGWSAAETSWGLMHLEMSRLGLSMEHGAKVLATRVSLPPSGLKSGGSRIYSGTSKGLLSPGADGDQRDSTTQACDPGPAHWDSAQLRTHGDPATVPILQRGQGAQRSEANSLRSHSQQQPWRSLGTARASVQRLLHGWQGPYTLLRVPC